MVELDCVIHWPSVVSWVHQMHECSVCATTALQEQDSDDPTRYSLSLSASITVPMSPQNRGNVLGILVWGFTSISTFLWVWMYTCSKPALFSGLSINIRRHCRQDYTFHKCQLNYVIQSKMTLQQDTKSVTWWVMSGRAELKSRPCFFRIDLWSSQFSNSNFFPH